MGLEPWASPPCSPHGLSVTRCLPLCPCCPGHPPTATTHARVCRPAEHSSSSRTSQRPQAGSEPPGSEPPHRFRARGGSWGSAPRPAAGGAGHWGPTGRPDQGWGPGLVWRHLWPPPLPVCVLPGDTGRPLSVGAFSTSAPRTRPPPPYRRRAPLPGRRGPFSWPRVLATPGLWVPRGRPHLPSMPAHPAQGPGGGAWGHARSSAPPAPHASRLSLFKGDPTPTSERPCLGPSKHARFLISKGV